MTRVKVAFLSIILVAASPAWSEDLRKAVRTNDVQRVKTLLESGADANTSYENRSTPIFFARSPEVVDLLLSHGAELGIRDAASIQSPIENAAEIFFRDKKHRDNWRMIVAKLRNAGAEYTIDTAIYMNDLKFVREQLAADASWVNKSRGAQTVPLRVAARTGRVEICKMLLEHKADPDSFEEGNGYPIMKNAVNHPAIVKLLIDHGANLKRRITWLAGRTGFWIIGDEGTALHYAVRDGNLESVTLLVDAGLDPNAADDKGQTPLHLAILFGQPIHFGNFGNELEEEASVYPKIVAYLLKNDASLRFTDREGRTPAELAKQLGSPKVIRKLLDKAQNERDAKYRKARFERIK